MDFKQSGIKKRILSFFKTILGLCLNFVAFIFSSMIIFAISSLPLPMFLGEILGMVFSISIILIFMWLTVHFLERRKLSDFHINITSHHFFLLIIGLIIGAITFGITVLPLYLSGQYQLSISGNWSQLISGFTYYVMVACGEELLCRSFILHKLLRYGPITALLLSSSIFSLLHILNFNFSFISLLNIILAGTFIGAIMYATKSIMTAIGFHITWNWIQGSVLGIPVSGNTTNGFFTTVMHGDNTLLTGGAFGAEASLLCTFVLGIGTILFLFYAYRNGGIKDFTYN